MRIQTLSEMLADLRAEAGISQNIAHGVTAVEPHKALLRRVQEELYLAYDWPHLQTSTIVSVSAGTRYKAYPDTFTFDGIERAWTKDASDRWVPLGYGISTEELNVYDSDTDERAYPVRSWQNYMQPTGDTSNNMFEVWPIPDTDTSIKFEGKRAIFPLEADDKTSTLDGPVIVLFAAAELLARQKSDDAGLKLQKGMDRLRLLKIRQRGKNARPANLAGGSPQRVLRPGLDYMPRRA